MNHLMLIIDCLILSLLFLVINNKLHLHFWSLTIQRIMRCGKEFIDVDILSLNWFLSELSHHFYGRQTSWYFCDSLKNKISTAINLDWFFYLYPIFSHILWPRTKSFSSWKIIWWLGLLNSATRIIILIFCFQRL